MRNFLRRFQQDRRGSIALYMAAAILPLTLLIGAATDLRRVETARSKAQDASDAAVLAAARTYMSPRVQGRTRLTPAQRLAAARTAAEQVLLANLSRDGAVDPATGLPPDFSRFDWELKFDPVLGEMAMDTRAAVPLAFGGLFRMSDFAMGARSAATVRIRNLEVALVLDNTGSMDRQNKIGVLRDSTVELIDTLNEAAGLNPDRANALKIALVPFSMTVRLPDPENLDDDQVTWLRGNPAGASYGGVFASNTNRFDLHRAVGGWRGCVEVRPSNGDHDIRETVNGGAGAYAPFTQPSGDPNEGCAMVPLRPLSNDIEGVRAAARSMTATGNTNIPLGLIWGWHTLSPSGVGPFGDGVAYGTENTLKAVVLMTDGENHINVGRLPDGGPYSGLGLPRQGRINGISAESDLPTRIRVLDGRLRELCSAMKAREITIYTVRLIDGSEETLKDCATSPDKYFFVSRPDQLSVAFNQIAGDIISLRLSK